MTISMALISDDESTGTHWAKTFALKTTFVTLQQGYEHSGQV